MLTQTPNHTQTVHRPIVVPVAPAHGLIDPALDQALSSLAIRFDRSDPELRNALFAAYAPRLRRILMRLWRRNLSEWGCELCDLEQELFIIFASLLERWPGNGSLSAYLHGALPWRLYDAARSLAPRERTLASGALADTGATAAQDDAEITALIEDLANRLAPFDRDLLLFHVRDGKSLGQIASEKGTSVRTVRRSWLRIKRHLHQELLR